MTKDDYLRKAAELSLELESVYKARLFNEVLKPMIDSGLLSGPSGNESWYSLKSFDEMIAMLGERIGYDAIFRIPTTCGTWFNAEIDPHTLKPFRFFSGSAWLTVKIPTGSESVNITVVHAIDYDAVDNLTIKANDFVLVQTARDIDGHGRTVLHYALPMEITSIGEAKFEFTTDGIGIPALKFENNSDWRRLSVAIFYPEFI